MFREFAVEPSLIADFPSARYFLEKFGSHSGRLIARFPKHWKREVYRSLKCGPVQKSKVEILLNRLDNSGFAGRPGVGYDEQAAWLDQARVEDARKESPAFDAILSNGVSDPPKILDGQDLDETNALWAVSTDKIVRRQAGDMADAVSLLLCVSRHIRFVDPYFDGNKKERTRPILECIRRALACSRHASPIGFEIHFSNPNKKSEAFIRDGLAKFEKRLPKGAEVTVYHWAEKSGAEQFHNRHIITDVGGVAFEAGLDEKSGPTDRLSLMSPGVRNELSARLDSATGVFDLVGIPVVLVGR